MSEENNLSSSNLCTTEDAFEQFQSVAMFEEDEFITLSDIVPPQPVVPDHSNEINEIPYDNEVVLTSTHDEVALLHLPCNNTVESSQPKSNEVELEIIDKSTNNATDEHTIAESNHSENKTRTRGKTNKIQTVRKRKLKSNENQSYQNEGLNVKEFHKTEDSALIDNQAVQDNVLSTTMGKNYVESKNVTHQESKYPRRTRRERIPNTSKYPLISETSLYDTKLSKRTAEKHRGRPKKAPLENSTISEPDSTNVDNTPLAHENYQEEGNQINLEKSGVKKCRRGRPKLSLSHTKVEQTQPNGASNNTSESTSINVPVKDVKRPRRRGRKKISETTEKPADSIVDSQESNEGNHVPEIGLSSVEENKLSLNESLEENMAVHDDDNSINSNSVKMSGKLGKKIKLIEKVIDGNGENMTEESLNKSNELELDTDDDTDDVCLSKLKENFHSSTEDLEDNNAADIPNTGNENDELSAKRNSKMPEMADFEYNIDKIVKEASLDGQMEDDNLNESLLVEDTSKRPNRRKTKQVFKYDEGSDEDPFANMELSDDEPNIRKKSRYQSDDEYIPGKKRGMIPVTSSDSEIDEDLDEGRKQKRKKIFKNIENQQSPKKRGRKNKLDAQGNSLNEHQDEDIEACTESPSIKPEDEPLSMKPPAEAWATSNEFENFIAQKIQGSNLKIKKISSKQKTASIITPIEIPVLDQNEPKKMSEISTQTSKISTSSTGMQTCVPYDIPMKTNMHLTTQQSEKACEFLNSVVKTTVELGQLMKEKSEDFMKKKINTETVTDTFKMDYCVRKSFLLFKLARHNLMQMEEDLANQYDQFLKSNNLSSCREELKNVTPNRKVKAESDSDCEIVDVKEVPTSSKKKEKTKFNPKTVFLNKELSIKIAKKPSADKNVDIKGRHTVWISDSVMVKKVKPTQSFLAQDSRNKKPPDYITEKMVSDFFKDYYRQKALAVCAPYINTEWSGVRKEYACHYFVKCNDLDESDSNNTTISINVMENNASTSTGNYDMSNSQEAYENNPKSLSSLCAAVICNCLHVYDIKEANEDMKCNLTDGKKEIGPLSLFRLCIRTLSSGQQKNMSIKPSTLSNKDDNIKLMTALPLKSLCYQKIAVMMPLFGEMTSDNCKNMSEYVTDLDKYEKTYDLSLEDSISDDDTSLCQDPDILSANSGYCEDAYYVHTGDSHMFINNILVGSSSANHKKNVTSLLSLCVESIQRFFGDTNHFVGKKIHPISKIEHIYSKSWTPKPLKYLVYENIKHLMYKNKLIGFFVKNGKFQNEEMFHSCKIAEDFTINCINTLSEEAFRSLDAPNRLQDNDYDYEPEITNFDNDNEIEDNEWSSQVQMQELRSYVTPVNNLSENEYDGTGLVNACVLSTINSTESEFVDANVENDDQYESNPESNLDSFTMPSQVKLEPLDDVPENVDPSIVKTEPGHGYDAMTIIPESVITKSEMIEQNTSIGAEDLAERENSAYDVNTFEQFVRSNKMIRSMDYDSDSDEMFSQSGLRIRRQHEPDNDAENDMNESLLVPQTFEPLHIENAKGVLMESSSDESMNADAKRGKKKTERKKAKQKKGKESVKSSNTKEISTVIKEVPVKDKTHNTNEVAILTRRMREKIRQEEKKVESSDSEIEDNISLSLRKDKNKLKENEKNKVANLKLGESSKDDRDIDNEIQCNNVDSTEQILEKRVKSKGDSDKFTGFSAIDQNEISSYQKYMKYVYDKIVPADEDVSIQDSNNFDGHNQDSYRSSSPVVNPDYPVELLECEPIMPIFDDDNIDKVKQPKKIDSKKKENKLSKNETKLEIAEPKSGKDKSKLEKDKAKFTEYDGWHLYNIDTSDPKLHQECQIPLEKLPESFVETYLEYHDITDRDKIDKEVDRLVNLQSLNRVTGIKEGKSKSRQTGKSSSNEHSASGQNSENFSRLASPASSDRFDELTPSEDEGANVDDECPPPVTLRTTEECIAKNSLMDENESDSDTGGTKKIKQELIDMDQTKKMQKPGPKFKTEKPKEDTPISSKSVMLTADKMMNKELTLLHAPIVLKEEVKEPSPKEPSPKDETKSRKRSGRNASMRDRFKTEDDSSSEEEKQWVTTKEKLLKRIMGKKEDAIADDAKRAKLVDDFIERRGEGPGRRVSSRLGSRRSRKKFLERIKQQSILSKELYGEPSIDLTPGGKRGAATGLFKGRRNIRKVIDKKSLQRSTVLANMEEFERKRRLNARQNQLRELLGCEEGVNVLVINDEVCLEYDFEEQRPVVTVHPFFTKVMKAHQYEGVKFMWDACFESLASIEAGRGGGGCILAHCMGLGKTLQVLALLHTVLTHPRAGMHRVLVCCPLSTVLNWVDEIHKWIGPVTNQIKVFELSKLKKTYQRAYQLEDWYNGGGIFIIGYELFRSLTTLDPMIDEIRPTIINKIRTALLDPGPDIIICDEGHLLKNDCSVLAVAMSRVVTKRRIVLTGTPMQNNLREYYCMVNFVKPNLLGTYSEYSNRFENPIMNGQHRDSSEDDIRLMKARTHILHKVLEGCLQRQEASVLYPYLPKKHEYTVFIPLTKCQWDLYKHYVHHYTKKSKQSVLRDFHILQKIWSHPQVLHNFQIKSRDDSKKKEIKPEKLEDDLALEDKEDIKPTDTEVWWLQYLADGAMLNSLDSSNKFVAVFRILHECIALGDKVLIFSTSLFCLDALEYFLRQINSWSLGQEYYRLDGSVPAEVRQKWVREFNAENNVKTKLFLISTRAGCLGLNMTAANRVIILDTSWNPAHDIQSIFRVYRFGQKKDCYIYRLVAMGTMEQKIYERSVTKQAVACRVVDEQQIDRHYNMAELTELYRFDEFGSGVAGGVAVGVGDVALLRVARDAAVHAVHEHDSLLRGSSEQGLPEHERAAAWRQFQQEHAHKQMQNDLETDEAARALQKLQEQQIVQQQRVQQQPQVLSIKTEDGPVHDSLLVPKLEKPAIKGRGGRGRGRKANVVQCRIPIKADSDQPGPSQPPAAIDEDEMVRQISDILIKYNFTQTGKGPKQIHDLVAKVKQMVRTGQSMSLGGCDELTSSIASVLMQRQGAAPPGMPALTDVEPERRRGRRAPDEPPPLAPLSAAEPGRRRRKAALAAERQFDVSDDAASQDSLLPAPVIELDDDDWHGAGAGSDTDSATEIIPQPPPAAPERKPETKKRRARKILAVLSESENEQDEMSILLSDDEVLSAEKSAPLAEKSAPATAEPVIPLHPSLLSNQNFIKIVAHTYLAGNPMLDEDAATLAAQYSTLRLLKETESSGKPIESGPIYDIAINILGKEVLKKLQTVDPKSKDRSDANLASSKLSLILGQEAGLPAALANKKPGPKSRVKSVEDLKETSKIVAPTTAYMQNSGNIVPVTLVRRASPAEVASAPAPPAADECILPDDDDDVRCITAPAAAPSAAPSTAPAAAPTTKHMKFKLKLMSIKKEQDSKTTAVPQSPTDAPPIRVTAGGAAPAAPALPAPDTVSKTYATICLDSEDDEPPAPAPASARSVRAARQVAQAQQYSRIAEGPVPVALMGPNSQPLPLALGSDPAPAPLPAPQSEYYSYTSAPALSYANANSGPVPISLTGPDNRPVPISLTGPGFQSIPISIDGPESQVAPAVYAGASVPMSFASGAPSLHTFTVPSSAAGSGVRPVAMSYVGAGAAPHTIPLSAVRMTAGAGPGGMRAVRLGMPPGQAPGPAAPGSVLHHMASNIFLVPKAAGERVLTCVSAAQVPPGLRLQTSPPSSMSSAQLQTTAINTICQPGDILRLTKTGQLEVLKNSTGVIHTIDDDEPLAAPTQKTPALKVPIQKAPTPKVPIPRRPTTKPSILKASTTPAQKAPTPAPKAPTPAPKAPTPAPKVPTPTPKPPVPVPKSLPSTSTTPLKPITEDQERRPRKVSTCSSSSSSDSSRSPSPDPLSILKDVVHIQAPQRRKNIAPTPNKADTSTSKQPVTTNKTKIVPKPTQQSTSSNGKDKLSKNTVAQNLNSILQTVKARKKAENNAKSTQGKSDLLKSTNKATLHKIKDSIDLTEISFKPAKPGDSSKNNQKAGKPTIIVKKDGPSTVVGTSKNIVLDAKSKSLTNKSMVDLTGQKSVQVMNVKTLPPPAANKQKPQEKKRLAPPAETAAPKKKKTELMTLKDFDIDDIDDIIELD